MEKVWGKAQPNEMESEAGGVQWSSDDESDAQCDSGEEKSLSCAPRITADPRGRGRGWAKEDHN